MERVQSLRHRISAENMTNGTLVLMNEKPDSEQVSELFQKAISLIVGGDYVKAREVLRESTAIDMKIRKLIICSEFPMRWKETG